MLVQRTERFSALMPSPSSPRAQVSEKHALETLEAAVAAWNARDLRALAEFYTPDITYWMNWGGPDNGSREISGRQALIRHFADIRDATQSNIKLTRYRVDGNNLKAHFEVRWRDQATGLGHFATCRQLIAFAGGRICRIEDYQDGPAMQAFWSLNAEQG